MLPFQRKVTFGRKYVNKEAKVFIFTYVLDDLIASLRTFVVRFFNHGGLTSNLKSKIKCFALRGWKLVCAFAIVFNRR